MKYIKYIIIIVIILLLVLNIYVYLFPDQHPQGYDTEKNETMTDVVREAAEDTAVKGIHINLDNLKDVSEKSIKEHTFEPLKDYSDNFDTDKVMDFIYSEGSKELTDEAKEYAIDKIK